MIRIDFHSGIYTLRAEQTLPISLEKAWDFFSSPANLAQITPPHMGFKITSEPPPRMFQGQIITYTVGVLPWWRTNWVTEITHVREPYYFVDEQRFGPYAMWHHEHWFTETEGGVNMLDRVSYKLPLDPVGRVVHPYIRGQLLKIFGYRSETLAKLFPTSGG